MLILTRRVGETLMVGDDVTVTVLGVKGHQVRIGVNAPQDVAVHREEIWQRIQEEKKSKCNEGGSCVNENSCDLCGSESKENEWINLNSNKLANIKMPDDNSPIDLHESIKVWARWDNGEIEETRFLYTGIDKPIFQRMCGTNEGSEGWDGNVGYVTHWMPYNAPLPPQDIES